MAPDCNVQCNFCKRIYDCANESRPGVTSACSRRSRPCDYLESVLQEGPADHGGGNRRAGRPVRHARTDPGNAASGPRASSRDAALRGVERIERGALCRRPGRAGGKPRHADRQRRRSGDRRQDLRLGPRRKAGLPRPIGGRVALGPPGGGHPCAEGARDHGQDQHDHHPRRER